MLANVRKRSQTIAKVPLTSDRSVVPISNPREFDITDFSLIFLTFQNAVKRRPKRCSVIPPLTKVDHGNVFWLTVLVLRPAHWRAVCQ